MTIASVLTAIGMCITAIVLAIQNAIGAVTAAPKPTPPPKPDQPKPEPPKPAPRKPEPQSVKEWVKQRLQDLGRLLAQKAAAALPGIIGSIVSWLLNFLSKSVGRLAGYLWALVVVLGGLLLLAAREWLTKKP